MSNFFFYVIIIEIKLLPSYPATCEFCHFFMNRYIFIAFTNAFTIIIIINNSKLDIILKCSHLWNICTFIVSRTHYHKNDFNEL